MSTQNKGEAAKLKVTYSLSADSGMESVETRLYVPGQTISYPQFTANGETRFVDPVTGRVFDLKRDENWNLYIEYTLHRGETFEEEFQFVDPSVTAGSQSTFEVSITTRGTIPANSSVQTTTARVTYAVWAEETEAPVETETAAETETETETETVSEAESETETAVETESETETETAAVTESETETETESETEIVTETETAQVETENAGIFDYEDDKAQISVEILNLTPENQGLRFAVNSIGEESKTFEKIAEQIMEGGSTALVDMLAYYIGVVDETGKAPAENELIYQITMKFKTPVLSISDYLSEEDKDSTEGEVKVYVEGTEIPADIQKNKKGAITGISFITDKVGNTAVALTSGLQTTADITMKTESNEYFMKLEDAKQTNLKVDMSVVKGEARNDVQNAKASAKLTYYDADGNEVEGITPAELQGFGVGQGSYLGNSLNNINGSDREKVVYVKIFMEAGELADTSFKFGEDDPSYDQGSRTLTFKLAKRTFEPDEEITTKKGITYIAVGPNHQYGLTGPLGLVSNFHAIGFSKVTNGAHTNGNILTKKLNYKNNFGTNGLTGEISYIRSFESIAAGMMCGDGSDDILVLGKDIDVTWAGNTFYLNGQKLTRPMTIYQDTEEYQYLDIDTAKEEAESLSSQFGALPDAGVTFENKTFKVSNGYSGMTVINVGHGMLGTEALAIEGLHNQSSTSLLINVRVPKGTEEITIPNVSINGTSSGSGEVIDFSAGKVIWNVVYEDGTLYTGKVSNGGAVAGTILVPDGKVHAAHNWNGSLIADEIEITGETHRTDFTGVLGFGVSKVLKGRDWKLSDRFQFELSAKEGTPMPIGSKTREGVQKKIISVTYSNRSPSFGGITYGTADIGKTYQYTLKELEGNIKDIIYSEAVYTIQVSIQSNNDQGLLIIKKYSKDGGKTWEDKMPEEDVFEFTNVSGVEFKVKKKYNSTYPGKNDDNVFKFVLKGLNEAPMPQKDENAPKEPNDQKTIIVTSSEEVSFDSITYKEDGTYKYEISEVKGKLNGVTYDEKVYDVKVEVSKDENGTGVIKVSSREKGAEDAEYKLLEKGTVFTAEFTNTYDDASAEIKVQKNYNGTYPEGDNAFKFILKALNGAPLPKIEEEEPSEAAVQSTQDTQREVVVTNGEPVSFGTIEYSTKGTYYYEVSEVTESLPGVTYDETVYEVKVEVTENEDKTKTVKVSYRKQSKEGEPERDYQALESGTVFMAEFINTYKAEPVETTVSGTKTLTGQTLKENQFDFELRLVEKDNAAVSGDAQKVLTAKNKADGSISFGTLKYTEAGTYVYEASETSESGNGISVDASIFTVTVKVKDNGLGQLVIESQTVKKNGVSEPLAFKNEYKTGEAEAEVKAKKTLTGRDLKADEFEFSLTPVSAVAADGTTAIEDTNTAQTTKNTEGGDVVFGKLTYKKAGTYTYELKETSVNGNGVTVDSTVYTVTVTVVDEGNGTLTATPAYSIDKEKADPEFHNTYKAKSVKTTVEGTKTLTGQTLQKDQFDFALKLVSRDGDVAGAGVGTVLTAKNDGEGKITFGPIEYTEEGTYVYEASETSKSGKGISVDTSIFTVTVKVKDNGLGQLVIESQTVKKNGVSEPLAFKNEYKTGEAEAEVKATKTLTGRDLKADEFEFSLTPVSAVAEDGTAITDSNAAQTTKNTEGGAVVFEKLKYTKAGTYTYEMKETSAGGNGVTVDSRVYTVTVTVVDNGDGTLTANPAYSIDKEKVAPEFINTYKAEPVETTVSGTKTLTGQTLKENQFDFELRLVEKDNAAVSGDAQKVLTAKNKADGSISFGTLKYTEAGTYVYEASETSESGNGISVDASIFTVTVKVKDNGLGQLVIESQTVKKNGVSEPLAFKNEYKTGEAEAEVKATKTLTGRDLKADEFEFSLTPVSAVAEDGTAITDSNAAQTTKNTEGGAVVFEKLKYTKAGTYTYEMKETSVNGNGVTVDSTVYTVTVTVVDNGDGTLTATPTYSIDKKTVEPEFENIYKPAETTAVFTAEKKVEGPTIADDTFTFELYRDEVEGTPLDTQTITGKGTVDFAEQTYEEAGTYFYKIVEKAGTTPGYTYDASVYTVIVEVEDSGGELMSRVTYVKDEDETGDAVPYEATTDKEAEADKDEESLEAAIFTNTYKPAETTAVFTAEKKVEGPTIADDTFTFELYKDKVEGTPLDTQTITGNGTVDFAEQTYEEAGTYTYKIVEKAGTTPGYTYDASIYTVIVEVTDIGGKLESKVTYVKDLEKAAEGEEVMPSENALFTNTYKPAETTAVFTAEKKVEGLTPADSTFTFELYKNSVEAANLLDTQNITGAGITAFAEQTYDAAGIYTYKIVEKAGEEAGYTYDTSVYTVTVEVTDIGGKLVSKVAYAKDGADNAAGEVLATAVFTNTYNAGDTKAVFTAKKTIKGDPQKTSRFTFELYKDSILEANLLDTKSIRGEGTVDFAEQTYDVPGTYTYKIVEKAGETAGYSYDGSIYTVTVEVTDIGGKLTNTVTYVKDDAAAGAAAPTAAEFINTYDAGKTNAVLTATKTIKGTPAKDSKFTFELYKDSVAEENLLDTKSITGTGSVNFKEQNYKAVGTYTYKIVEKAGEEAGYIYDTSVYTATVVVTDKGGELARKITYTKDGAEESKAPASAVFENTYDAGSTEAVFEVTKAVNGTPKKAGTFTFELYKDSVKEANLLDTQTIKGQGRAEFAAQTYKEPGTYTYKIIEKAGNEEGYTYDNSVYTVTVTVTDEGGRLDNTVTYENENGARRVYQAAEFVNEYKEKLGRIVVTKQVVNQTLDGEVPYLVTDTFYFALFKDEALTEMSDYGIKTLKLKNQSEGKVVFEDVDFGEYYLAETDKDGNPVTAPPFIEYFVTIEDPLCEVTKAESTVKKIVKNAKLPDNYGDFGDGEMIIDKYVLNGSEEYTVTDTFYFTLFRDEELKIPYEQFETKKLDLNDEAHGTVTFEKLPYGVYYLAETDADGKPVGDGFDYEVKIEKKQFTISETNKKETIRIDNCITPDTPGGKHTPKTGDDTLIWPYVTMMLAALVAGTGSIFGKRRRKRSSK